MIKLFYNYSNLLFYLCWETSAKCNRLKKYNYGNDKHLSQEELTEIDNPFKKRKVKLIISFSVIHYLQQNKIILIVLIIIDRTCIDPLMNIRYMCKLALGSRNDENSVLTFFQTFRLRLESSSVRIYFYKK